LDNESRDLNEELKEDAKALQVSLNEISDERAVACYAAQLEASRDGWGDSPATHEKIRLVSIKFEKRIEALKSKYENDCKRKANKMEGLRIKREAMLRKLSTLQRTPKKG
jgi:hypothetical protein